jgi:uncharacterized protein with HEPN domain
MLEASRTILRYADGTTLEDVRDNEVLADAIIHRLTVLGRAAARISPSLRAQNSDIHWQRIGDLRKLARQQSSRELVDMVWNTVTEDVPRLVPRLEVLVPPEPSGA